MGGKDFPSSQDKRRAASGEESERSGGEGKARQGHARTCPPTRSTSRERGNEGARERRRGRTDRLHKNEGRMRNAHAAGGE